MLDQYICQLDPVDQRKFRELTAKYSFLAEITMGYLRHRDCERLKANFESDMAALEQRKREWLGWYEGNLSRYARMAADLDRAKSSVALLSAELAIARSQIRQQNRHPRRPHGSEQQIPLFVAA